MSAESWNRIVDFYFENIDSPETSIQFLWETVFSDVQFFGYSKLLNEIDSQRNVKIGSKERAVPDIIIRNNEKNTDLFIVELKRSRLDIGADQLFSYLKLLKMDIGILIADKIYLYSYDYTKPDSEQAHIEIPFEKENIDGIIFLQLFSKSSFSKTAIKQYINGKYKASFEIEKIRSELTPDLLRELAEKYFRKKYEQSSITIALNDFKIEITNSSNSKTLKEINFNNAKNLDKSKIRLLCKDYGIYLPENLNSFVKAKLNVSATKKYWANPGLSKLNTDLWLVLEDPFLRNLHVFFIPANSITKNQIVLRKDKDQIDIQIAYNDINFTETKSGLAFRKWYIRTIQY